MGERLPCGCNQPRIGIQYGYEHPEHYDGVSEWQCSYCDRRWGRWSGVELSKGEHEPRYGRGKRNGGDDGK